MGKFKVNMKANVLISTAGPGTRMATAYPEIHKSLLPYNGRPILYEIISKVPKKFLICIILGYKSEQIKNFLAIMFPDRKFEFVYVDDWTSKNSGTAYSLKFAIDSVQDTFWYLPCDGVYTQMDFFTIKSPEDLFVVSKIRNNEAKEYLTMELKEKRVLSKKFKKKIKKQSTYAFTGVMKIMDKNRFFTKLEKLNAKEFIDVIDTGDLTYITENWTDLGNLVSYKNNSSTQVFDFSKNDEFTYEFEKLILKWWANPAIAQLKMKKPNHMPEAFPKNSIGIGEFYRYDLAKGVTFYDSVNPGNFQNFLDWMVTKVWKPKNIDITNDLSKFYKEKTISRIKLLESKLNSEEYNPISINGVDVKNWRLYFEQINWDMLINLNCPTFIHGDLQFDNIIHDKKNNKFILIDWRYEFGNQYLYGDLYYDFAKLLGGILHNYKLIKNGELDFQFNKGNAEIKIPSVQNQEELIKILETTALNINLDLNKIRLLVPLILWNMAPLHKEPFSSICWSLGLKYFETYQHD